MPLQTLLALQPFVPWCLRASVPMFRRFGVFAFPSVPHFDVSTFRRFFRPFNSPTSEPSPSPFPGEGWGEGQPSPPPSRLKIRRGGERAGVRVHRRNCAAIRAASGSGRTSKTLPARRDAKGGPCLSYDAYLSRRGKVVPLST